MHIIWMNLIIVHQPVLFLKEDIAIFTTKNVAFLVTWPVSGFSPTQPWESAKVLVPRWMDTVLQSAVAKSDSVTSPRWPRDWEIQKPKNCPPLQQSFSVVIPNQCCCINVILAFLSLLRVFIHLRSDKVGKSKYSEMFPPCECCRL